MNASKTKSSSRYGGGVKSSSKKYGTYKKGKTYQYNKGAKQVVKNYRRNIVNVARGPTPTQCFAPLKLTAILNVSIPTGSYNIVDGLASMLNLSSPSTFFTQQPVGFDQWSALFQRYTVHASSVEINAMMSRPDSVQNLTSLTLLPTAMQVTQVRTAVDAGGGTGTGTQCAIQNDRYAKNVYFSNTGANANCVVLKHYMKSKWLFPDKDVSDDPDFTGTTASYVSGATSPTQTANWVLILQANDQVASASGVEITIRATITYYTQFSSPVNLYDV